MRPGRLAVGASVGFVWYRAVPEDLERMIRQADEAMYEAKGAGKGRVVVRVVDGLPPTPSDAENLPRRAS